LDSSYTEKVIRKFISFKPSAVYECEIHIMQHWMNDRLSSSPEYYGNIAEKVYPRESS